MSEESMWRAVNAMNDAAQRAHGAADRLEQATQQLRVLFEDGYGGNALKLIELLEADQKPVVIAPNRKDMFWTAANAGFVAKCDNEWKAAIEAAGGKVAK